LRETIYENWEKVNRNVVTISRRDWWGLMIGVIMRPNDSETKGGKRLKRKRKRSRENYIFIFSTEKYT